MLPATLRYTMSQGRHWDQRESAQRIQTLSAEWAQISTMAAWESSIEQVRAENMQLRQEGLWLGGPRDFLGVIGRNRHEVTHSALVAWLLDPGMQHGLGVEFLERFLGRCFPEEQFENLGHAHCETEVARGRGRADIVVWGSDFTLVVENKVDALEGEDQCDYYYQAFNDEVRPLFVFLTPEGRRPTSAGQEAAEAYRALSYGEVLIDLAGAIESTRILPGARARSVAEGYLETLRNEFPTAE